MTKKKNRNAVQEIVLNENHKGLRIALFVAVLALALTAFTYGIYSLVKQDPGWREVEVKTGTADTCAGDFHFQYKLGSGAAAEYKKVQQIYTDACEYMEAVFGLQKSALVPGNLYAVNENIGTEVEVDPVLYEAFHLMEKKGDRALYLAPIYDYYDNLFNCTLDEQTADFDPFTNAEVAESFAEICAFTQNPDDIQLELLSGSRVKLQVSDAYREYAEENGITTFIDFYWMKNAFILDYLAEAITNEGFNRGFITSKDGFSISLGGFDESLSTTIYDLQPEGIYPAAVMTYEDARSIICFHDYTTANQMGDHFYMMADGTTFTPYIDPADGLCKSVMHDFLITSTETSCAEMLLDGWKVFIGSSDAENLPEDYAYCADRAVYHTQGITLTSLFASEDVQYTEKILP